MGDIRKERVIVSVTTLAGISCILQNYFGAWEFWVPFVILAGMIALWWVHIAEHLSSHARINLCFAFDAFLLFYEGIHETSLYDISVSVALFMISFIIIGRIVYLNLIMIEYAFVMGIQFWFLYRNTQIVLTAFDIMKIVYHTGTIFLMYIFSRITVNRRNAEQEKTREWIKTINDNNHDMEDFLSNISHELRTPVNVISGMTTIMQKNGDSSELSSIKEACIRLAHQIEDIQDYTEIKRGELYLEDENYMCVSLINDVVENYRASSRRNELELVVDIAPETPTMLKGDIQKLHKLFRHLLDNAIKFTKRGGIYIKVFPVRHDYGINLTIEVTDTGIGMTRADMSRVSKGMYQANKKRNRSTGGIGIGLPIVYGFVHKMGGFVNISSSKGHGTTVRLSIPQQVVDSTPCLSLKEDAKEGIVLYIRQEKYKVPEVREFYRLMAFDLAAGLKTGLYTAGDRNELERLMEENRISYICTGQEEYGADRDLLNTFAKDGCRIIVTVRDGASIESGNGICMIPKPLYAFPLVRIVNGECDTDGYQADDMGSLTFSGVRALVVDDEPMNLVVATGLLRDYDMVIETAESGRDAVKKYEDGDYDVIFMDHMMPGMDGVEAMKLIRQTAEAGFRTPVIIALTANALSGAREMFMREGFDGFIAKPIDIGEFERVMKSVLPDEMIHYEGRTSS